MPAENSNLPAIKTNSDVVVQYLLAREVTEPILVSFINAVLADSKMKPIKSARVRNPFNPRSFEADKGTVLDIVAVDENRTRYNIEVQVLQERGFIDRCLLYNGKLFASQLRKNDKYSQLKPTISIVLTEFDLFPDLHRLHTTSMMTIIEAPGRILTDKIQIHFIQIPKKPDKTFIRGVNELLLAWLKFFNFPRVTSEEELSALAEKDEGIKMAIMEYTKFRGDAELRDLYRRREIFRHDMLSYTNTMVEEGREQGRAEGIEIGIEQGREEERTNLLLQAVESKFGKTKASFKKKIRAIKDPAVVVKLLTITIPTAQTIKDVEKAISG